MGGLSIQSLTPMRHPLLRILVALLIGLVTPLCCCQAMAMAGGGCGDRHEVAPAPDACCHGCSQDSAPDRQRSKPTGDDSSAPGKCPSCPSCQGTSSGTGMKADVRLPAFEQQWNVLVASALASLGMIETPQCVLAPSPPVWALGPPHLKANREALRWHCALVV